MICFKEAEAALRTEKKSASREAYLRRFADARFRTDELFGLLRSEAIYRRPIPERHRLIFYLGHLEAFDWNLIGRKALDMRSFEPSLDKLFEFGIDPPPGELPTDSPSDWPTVGEIGKYNRKVRDRVDASLADAPDQVLETALEHRLMHAETLAYLLHNLPYEDKLPRNCEELLLNRPAAQSFRRVSDGLAKMGRQSEDGFGWDNEFPQTVANVQEFQIGKYKISNGEYLEFVCAGGPTPHYWADRSGEWFYRGMFSEMPLPMDAPVYATHAQATSYARWRGMMLPTEEQWHRAAGDASYPWGEAPPSAVEGNFDFRHWDPVSVAATPGSDSPYGVSQLTGNGWEWTSTVFGPFEGFEPFAFYPGYSANFFDGEHFVMKGGSPRTAACMLRPSFRNWFRGDYPYVYGTFRLVGHPE